MDGTDNYRVIRRVKNRCVRSFGLISYFSGKISRQPREVKVVPPSPFLKIG
jgi:hypothetical protein